MSVENFDQMMDAFSRDPDGELARADQAAQSLAFAQLHVIFDMGMGRELLERWKKTFLQPVPVNSSIDEYARAEAMRKFLWTIEEQILHYKTTGR